MAAAPAPAPAASQSASSASLGPTMTAAHACGAVRLADRELYLPLAQQVLEILRYQDVILLIFRCACAYGKALSEGWCDFARFHQFLARAGLAEAPVAAGRRVSAGEPLADDPAGAPQTRSGDAEDAEYMPPAGASPASSSDEGDSKQLERRESQFRRLRNLMRFEEEGAQAAAERAALASEQEAAKGISEAVHRRDLAARGGKRCGISASEGPSWVVQGAVVDSGDSAGAGPRLRPGKREIFLSKLEADALFVQCTALGKETLSVRDFAVALLRIAELLHPEDYSTHPTSALQYILQDYMYAYVGALSPRTEQELALQRPLQTMPDVPAILFAYEVPLRKLFCRFVAKQQGDTDGTIENTVDPVADRLHFDGMVAFLSVSDVFPSLLSHADIYRTMRQLSTADGGEVAVNLDGFTDALIQLSWVMFNREPHDTKLPTVASRLFCFLSRLDEGYYAEFDYPIREDLAQSEKGLPELHCVTPACGSVNGGYDIVITGRSFCEQRGVFVRLGKAAVSALAVKESKIKVRVPPQEHDDFVTDIRIMENTYYCKVTFVRRVHITASNDGQQFTEPNDQLMFRYERVGHDFHLADLQAKILTVFVEYCSRDDYYNDRYLTLDKWVRFKRDYNIRELRLIGGLDGRPDTSCTEPWFREFAIVHNGQPVVNFKRFLTMLVTCVQSENPEGSPYDSLRQFFGAESALNSLLIRNLGDEQSSLTMAKIRQLNSALGMPGVVSALTAARHDTSPHPTGEDDIEGQAMEIADSLDAGCVTNEREMDRLLLDYLRRKRDEEEYAAFERWKETIDMDAQRARERQTRERQRAGDPKSPTAAAGGQSPPHPEAPRRQQAAQPAVIPSRPPTEDPGDAWRADLRDESVLLPQGPRQARPPARRSSASTLGSNEDWSSDDSLDDQIYRLGHGQLHDLLLRFAGDGTNTVMRREYMMKQKFRRRIAELRETVAEREREVLECKQLMRRMREMRSAGCGSPAQELDRELLSHTHLKIERELMELDAAETETQQGKPGQVSEEKLAEIADREREKVLQEFKVEIRDAEYRFKRMASVLADQTQWMESHRQVVTGLKERLSVAEAEARAYQALAQDIEQSAGPDASQATAEEIKTVRDQTEEYLNKLRSKLDREAEDVAEAMRAVTRAGAIDRLRMAVSKGQPLRNVASPQGSYGGAELGLASPAVALPTPTAVERSVASPTRSVPAPAAPQPPGPPQPLSASLLASEPEVSAPVELPVVQEPSQELVPEADADGGEGGGKATGGKKKAKKKPAAKKAPAKKSKKARQVSETLKEDQEPTPEPSPSPAVEHSVVVRTSAEDAEAIAAAKAAKQAAEQEMDELRARLILAEEENSIQRGLVQEQEAAEQRARHLVEQKERAIEMLGQQLTGDRLVLEQRITELEQRLQEAEALEHVLPEGSKGAVVYQLSGDETIASIAERFGQDPVDVWAVNDLNAESAESMEEKVRQGEPQAVLVPLGEDVYHSPKRERTPPPAAPPEAPAPEEPVQQPPPTAQGTPSGPSQGQPEAASPRSGDGSDHGPPDLVPSPPTQAEIPAAPAASPSLPQPQQLPPAPALKAPPTDRKVSIKPSQYFSGRRREFKEHRIDKGRDTLRSVCELYGVDEDAVRLANLLLPSTTAGEDDLSNDVHYLAGIASGVLRIPLPGSEGDEEHPSDSDEQSLSPGSSPRPPHEQLEEPPLPQGVLFVRPVERRIDAASGQPLTRAEFEEAGRSAEWQRSAPLAQRSVPLCDSPSASSDSDGVPPPPQPVGQPSPAARTDLAAECTPHGVAATPQQTGRQVSHSPDASAVSGALSAQAGSISTAHAGVAALPGSSADQGVGLSLSAAAAGSPPRRERTLALKHQLAESEARLRQLRGEALAARGGERAMLEHEVIALSQSVGQLRARYLRHIERWHDHLRGEAARLRGTLGELREAVKSKAQGMLMLARNELARLMQRIGDLPNASAPGPPPPPPTPPAPSQPSEVPPPVTTCSRAIECVDLPYCLPVPFKAGRSRSHAMFRGVPSGVTCRAGLQSLQGGSAGGTGFGHIPYTSSSQGGSPPCSPGEAAGQLMRLQTPLQPPPSRGSAPTGWVVDGVPSLEHRRAEKERRVPVSPREERRQAFLRDRAELSSKAQARIAGRTWWRVSPPSHAESIAWRYSQSMDDKVPEAEQPFAARGLVFPGRALGADWVRSDANSLLLPRRHLVPIPETAVPLGAACAPPLSPDVTTRQDAGLPARSDRFAPMVQHPEVATGLRGRKLSGAPWRGPTRRESAEAESVPCALLRLEPAPLPEQLAPGREPPAVPRRIAELFAVERKFRCAAEAEFREQRLRIHLQERGERAGAARRGEASAALAARAAALQRQQQQAEAEAQHALRRSAAEEDLLKQRTRLRRESNCVRRSELREALLDGRREYATALRRRNEVAAMYAAKRKQAEAADASRRCAASAAAAAAALQLPPPHSAPAAPGAASFPPLGQHGAAQAQPAAETPLRVATAPGAAQLASLSGEQQAAVTQIAALEHGVLGQKRESRRPVSHALIRQLAAAEAQESATQRHRDWNWRQKVRHEAEARMLEQVLAAREHKSRAFTPQMRGPSPANVLRGDPSERRRPQTHNSGMYLAGCSPLPSIADRRTMVQEHLLEQMRADAAAPPPLPQHARTL